MGDETVHALDGVSFTIPRGDYCAIVGPSGSGKSTLMNILGGLDTPSEGRIVIDGADIGAIDDDGLRCSATAPSGSCSRASICCRG